MTKQEFRELVQSHIVVLDGATGSNLQDKGMTMGVCPEQWILEHEEELIDLQVQYIKAGSEILYSPTFTCNRIKLEEYGLEDEIASMNERLVTLSKEAIKRANVTDRKVYIAGDITMTGRQLYPMGTLMFEDLVDMYKEQVSYLAMAGVDVIIIETMLSLQECRAAVLAVKETCDLPIMVTLTFNEDGRTLYGTSPETAVVVLQSLGVDAVGVNCSTGPDQMVPVIEKMKEYANIPIIAKPNAGLPELIDGKTIFNMGPEEFAHKTADLVKAGANLIGGCCGTTPEHMRCLVEEIKSLPVINPVGHSMRILTTERNHTEITLDGPFKIVGERINPTGKKDLQAALREEDYSLAVQMAEEQEELGASILDVNMGMNGIDELETMVNVIYELTRSIDLPLAIDSSYVEVIEAALRIYPGRALINSISLETKKVEQLIPIAKKYGAMFILLPLSDAGLPKNIEEKKSIINEVLDRALKAGMNKEDIIVDGLVTTIGANKDAALQTLETIRYCKEELGLATICGLSNISFGLPERQFVNSTFLAFAIREGLTMAISNPSQDLLVNTAFAADLLSNKQGADIRYIDQVSKHPLTISSDKKQEAAKKEESGSEKGQVFEDVLKGNQKQVVASVKQALEAGNTANEILDTMLIPAINQVGAYFEEKKYFLPQLIASAETMKAGIAYIKPMLKEGKQQESLGTIVIATVQGDIHDIGKNLVALMLENYGFEVIDLGKDVSNEVVIEKAKEYNADIIALSALMTTTMMEMREVVQLAKKEKLKAKVVIGGAVITQSFADEIGADGYSADAQEAVKLIKRLLSV
ncbi:5-methyltetrahydrofolate--homocysteine methyltransferase [Lachnospiraceae bacterium KM106-2]|nr:5-methyltetrahydrofolate--homocysteine methyltransferase [Lachnospiraceae bacterium KM106-2]